MKRKWYVSLDQLDQCFTYIIRLIDSALYITITIQLDSNSMKMLKIKIKFNNNINNKIAK